MQKPHVRIFGIVNRTLNKAYLVRRGPSKNHMLLIWDFGTDELTKGQWLKGNTLNIMSVSPDGKYIVYFGEDMRQVRAKRSKLDIPEEIDQSKWIAISRPPFLTALALWFVEDGDVYFKWKDNETLVSFGDQDWYEAILLDDSILHIKNRMNYRELQKYLDSNYGQNANYTLGRVRYLDESWDRIQYNKNFKSQLITHRKRVNNGFVYVFSSHAVSLYWQLHDIHDNLVKRSSQKTSEEAWIDVDHSGRVVFSENGCLYAWKEFPEGEPTMIADLNEDCYRRVRTPDWAKEW